MGIVAGSGGVARVGTCEASSTAALAAQVPPATEGGVVAGFEASNGVGEGGVAAESVVSAGAGGEGASAGSVSAAAAGGTVGGVTGGAAGGGLLRLLGVWKGVEKL